MTNLQFLVRPATREDIDFMWLMLFYSAHMEEEGETSVDAAKDHDRLSRYLEDWGRDGDIGFVAVDLDQDRPVGAAWTRTFVEENKAYGYVDDFTPELVIAVAPGFRGCGIGKELLSRLVRELRGRYACVSLNVRTNNPAKRLYESLGFRQYGKAIENRIGGQSVVMTMPLPTQPISESAED